MELELNWDALTVDDVTREEIQRYVDDSEWQDFRKQLKGETIPDKYKMLKNWLDTHPTRKAKVQVTNYVNALKRAGLI